MNKSSLKLPRQQCSMPSLAVKTRGYIFTYNSASTHGCGSGRGVQGLMITVTSAYASPFKGVEASLGLWRRSSSAADFLYEYAPWFVRMEARKRSDERQVCTHGQTQVGISYKRWAWLCEYGIILRRTIPYRSQAWRSPREQMLRLGVDQIGVLDAAERVSIGSFMSCRWKDARRHSGSVGHPCCCGLAPWSPSLPCRFLYYEEAWPADQTFRLSDGWVEL